MFIMIVILLIILLVLHLYMINTLKKGAEDVQTQITQIVSGLPSWIGL